MQWQIQSFIFYLFAFHPLCRLARAQAWLSSTRMKPESGKEAIHLRASISQWIVSHLADVLNRAVYQPVVNSIYPGYTACVPAPGWLPEPSLRAQSRAQTPYLSDRHLMPATTEVPLFGWQGQAARNRVGIHTRFIPKPKSQTHLS